MDDFRDVLASSVGHLYVLERELGGGGMSRVWLARDKSLGRPVVIKVLDPAIAAAVSTARFRREIELSALLQHPQIVPLLTAGVAGGLPYYTMPYVEGESLRNRLRRGEPLAPSHMLRVLGDVASALDYAHRRGVIHRDIKPENVMLVGRSAMVIDFGIAKAITNALQGSEAALTVGESIGTPRYMAPEQIIGGVVDHRVDLYAWGLLAYELLSNTHPYAHSRSEHEFIRAHLDATPRDLRERDASISPTLTSLVMRCLEKSAANRPSSALDIIGVLDLLGGSTGDHPALPSRRRVNVPLIVMGAMVALLSVVLVRNRVVNTDAGSVDSVRSIAVIPFTNLSGDTLQEYFADGMADGLSTELGRLPGVSIASRTAAYRFKNRRVFDVREARRVLGVDAVVQGTVVRVSNRWRVSVQLTSAVTGVEIWSDRWDRDARDVLAVQDEMCAAVARELRVPLMRNAIPAIAGARRDSRAVGAPATTPVLGTRDPVAYDLYMLGRHLLERRGPGVKRAAELFDQALGKDSLFARAYASRALALLLVPFYNKMSLDSILPVAEGLAHRALALDPGLADGHLALAGVYRLQWNWSEALSAFRKAVQLDPRNVPARLNYAQLLYAAGDAAESLEQADSAKSLDPYSALALLAQARALTLFDRHQDVVARIERALLLDATLPQTRVYLAMALLRVGNPKRALEIVDSAPPIPSTAGEAAYVITKAGDRLRAQALIRQLHTQAQPGPFQYTAIGMAYLGMGNWTQALDALQIAAQKREPFPLNLAFNDPIYDSIRVSPRFADIVKAYGLDPRRFATLSFVNGAKVEVSSSLR